MNWRSSGVGSSSAAVRDTGLTVATGPGGAPSAGACFVFDSKFEQRRTVVRLNKATVSVTTGYSWVKCIARGSPRCPTTDRWPRVAVDRYAGPRMTTRPRSGSWSAGRRRWFGQRGVSGAVNGVKPDVSSGGQHARVQHLGADEVGDFGERLVDQCALGAVCSGPSRGLAIRACAEQTRSTQNVRELQMVFTADTG